MSDGVPYLKLESELESIYSDNSLNHEAFKATCLLKTLTNKKVKNTAILMSPYHYISGAIDSPHALTFNYHLEAGFATTSSPYIDSLRVIPLNVYKTCNLLLQNKYQRVQYFDLHGISTLKDTDKQSIINGINKGNSFYVKLSTHNHQIHCEVDLVMVNESGEFNIAIKSFAASIALINQPDHYYEYMETAIRTFDSGITSKDCKFRSPYESKKETGFKAMFRLVDLLAGRQIPVDINPQITGIRLNHSNSLMRFCFFDHTHKRQSEELEIKSYKLVMHG